MHDNKCDHTHLKYIPRISIGQRPMYQSVCYSESPLYMFTLLPQQLIAEAYVSFKAVLTDNVVRPPINCNKFCLSSPSLREFFFTGASAWSRAYFGQGTGAILLDQMRCTGNEKRLVNCPSNPLGIHDCSHSEDAGVTCQGTHAACVP